MFCCRNVFKSTNCRLIKHSRALSRSAKCYCAPTHKLTGVGQVEITLSNGRTLRLHSGKLARAADGCCVGQSGDTNVMVTAVSSSSSGKTASFVPLTVDYRQKAAAAGRIPTNFLRRELGPTEREILTSRVIDRSIRPLFPAGYFYNTQLVCNLLSVDAVNNPDVVAINAASAALTLSDIPWHGPVAAVRVGLIDNEVIINPTRREASLSKLDLVVSGTTSKSILMMEGYTKEPIVLNELLKALRKACSELSNIANGIALLQKSVGKPKRDVEYYVPSEEVINEAVSLSKEPLSSILRNYELTKQTRDVAIRSVQADVLSALGERFPQVDTDLLSTAFTKALKFHYSETYRATGKRCDGRLQSELRPISCEVDLYKPLHGSAIFQRGQTQVLCSAAFDSKNSTLRADPISVLTGGIKEKHFMLHYEFPSYATNEIGKGPTFGRREIGHGALAEKALRPILPEDFPFAIRLSCEVLESNGSSSMASVCAGSMALMDAGVPVSAAAAGVAMGLLTMDSNESGGEGRKYEILTDILGMEDYLGEMDFKIAGTKHGFTALQLDVKNSGTPRDVVMDSLMRSHDAKTSILSKMSMAVEKPRDEKKNNWPVSQTLEIPVHRRSQVLGFGGYNLKKLMADTGVQISQDPDNVNNFLVFAPNSQALEEANEIIEKLLSADDREPNLDFGAIYTATIVEIRDNGVMVTLHPNMRPVLLHLRELDQRKVHHPSALQLEVGQELQVKYFGRDPANGQLRISRRVLQMLNQRTKNYFEHRDKEDDSKN